jgi:hypothetical protein
MKTRNVLVALMMTVCTFAAVVASAQQEEPAIKMYQAGENLKLVFGYDSKEPVVIDFLDANGTFGTDKVDQPGLVKGFIRHYHIKRDNNDAYWVNVENDFVSARFRIETKKGKLTSILETVTYNNPIAKR